MSSINFNNSRTKIYIFLSVTIVLLISLPIFVLFPFLKNVKAEDRREEIQTEISDINTQIKSYQQLIAEMATEEKSLEEQKKDLEETLSSLEDQKEQTQISIEENNEKVEEIQAEIKISQDKENELKDQLSKIIRIIYEYKNDSSSSLELLLSDNKISNVINKIQSISAIQDNLDNVLDQTQDIKKKQEEIENQLLAKQQELETLYKMKAQQESETKSLVAYKQTLINQSQENQSSYSQRVANANKLKEELTREISLLSSYGQTITFEMAVAAAKNAGGQTGICPAFLLGILKQETNFGANVGTATYHTAYKGSSAEYRIQLFKQITTELGMNPETTKVSAWPGYGSGGAMGPCQFMPDTWMGYRDQVKAITGVSTPDPWNLNHCLVAMSLKLKKGGAASQKYEDEWTAALMYYCGNNLPSSREKYAFYPNSVMALATAYEKQI